MDSPGDEETPNLSRRHLRAGMDAQAFAGMAEEISRELTGRVFEAATSDEHQSGFRITLHFRDGTSTTVAG